MDAECPLSSPNGPREAINKYSDIQPTDANKMRSEQRSFADSAGPGLLLNLAFAVWLRGVAWQMYKAAACITAVDLIAGPFYRMNK